VFDESVIYLEVLSVTYPLDIGTRGLLLDKEKELSSKLWVVSYHEEKLTHFIHQMLTLEDSLSIF